MGVTKNQSVLIGINTQTFTANVEVASTHTAVLSGPVTIPNIEVNGVGRPNIMFGPNRVIV